ncbi:hypothetical protein KVR01_012189 [Diaporthe batatas]|uniref:uncharacterized protein n=1 Tax=Diaporthe batatas TaxID=748121 RepID=UPI001D048FE3|nr:uncharacterized protein KVR01_012189 [Diaporthe batatas]KAG8157917.1 hypothetical protein KVR01_012189 [Diaporthe batatas]
MGNPASLSCAENIALFHFLHADRGRDGELRKDAVPSLPSVAPVEALPTDHKNYILSFDRERSLASALAFISQIEDDPDHIPAVCIREDHSLPAKPSLRILLAVNKSEFDDGDDTLKKIRQDNHHVEIEHKIRRLIISMCLERILSRLRLTTIERRKTKQHPRTRFHNIIQALPSHGSAFMESSNGEMVSEKELEVFVQRLKEVVSLIDAYTNHPREQQAEDLVVAIARLRRLDCETMLNTISDDQIEANNKKSTLNMIRKVARYAEAARFLIRTCKKFPIARRMQVVIVNLPRDASARAPLKPEYSIDIASMLLRVKAPKRSNRMTQQSRMNTICRLLGTTPDRADEDLTKQAAKTHETGKVHAEVQMIAHYETTRKAELENSKLLPPRIVSSCKKACFLCDLLVKVHGKMQTPWSHGKLYPGWRLPDCPGLDLQERFNGVLENCIRNSIALLFERGERTTYPAPSESTLITLPSLASEPVSVPVPKNDDKVEMTEPHIEGTQTMSDVDGNTKEVDQTDSNPNSGPPSSLTSMRSADGKTSHEYNARIKPDRASQYFPVNQSHQIEKTVEGPSLQGESVQQEHSSCGKVGKEAKYDHDTSPQKDSEDSAHDGTELGNEDLRDTSNEAVISSDSDERSFQPTESCVDSVNLLGAYHHLKPGQKVSDTVHTMQMKTFFTRSLVVQVEYSIGPNLQAAGGKQRRELPFSIERLGVDEVARLKNEGILTIGKEEAVIGEAPTVLPSMEHVYVAAGGVVFRMDFH